MLEEVGYDSESDEPINLGSLLASGQEYPSNEAARNIDWELFRSTHDYRYGILVTGMAEGQHLKATAEKSGHLTAASTGSRKGWPRICGNSWASTAIEDSLHSPAWKSTLIADKERIACRTDRRRN